MTSALALQLVCGESAHGAGSEAPRTLETNRAWDVLSSPSRVRTERGQLLEAGQRLGDRKVEVAGVVLDGHRLMEVARSSSDERISASIRDATGRPIDLGDLLLFLDDVLLADRQGRSHERIHLTAGRARSHGILVHPDDVFTGRPRRYGERGPIAIDVPERQRDDLVPARDGDPPGPSWTMRFRNPADEEARLRALSEHTGDPGLERRVRHLVGQLREQGAEVYVNSTVRSRERGYLMWGAFLLSRADDRGALEATLERLERANLEWGLEVPIDWRSAGDWRDTREAAREMADTYQVVYATEQGARDSNHYGGDAIDIVAFALPRRLVLETLNGEKHEFDLSGVDQTLDLNLTPELIRWVEQHLGLQKLRGDYPHWDDKKSERLPAAKDRS